MSKCNICGDDWGIDSDSDVDVDKLSCPKCFIIEAGIQRYIEHDKGKIFVLEAMLRENAPYSALGEYYEVLCFNAKQLQRGVAFKQSYNALLLSTTGDVARRASYVLGTFAKWSDWKAIFPQYDFRVLDDDSGFSNDEVVSKEQAAIGLMMCTTESKI